MIQRRSRSGITLLELLISIALMAMIAVSLSSLFDMTGQVWQRLDRTAGVADRAVNRSELRGRLEAMPLVTIDAPLDRIFTSDTGRLSFKSDLNEETGWFDVVIENQALIARQDQVVLILREGLSNWALSYYGRKAVREELVWHDDWRDAAILPVLIKLETWQADGTPNPPFTVQPGKLTRQMEISLSSLVPPN